MTKEDIFWEEEIQIRYCETDQMGVVHHANIPIYFEIARAALFKNFIKSYAAIERRGVFAPIVAYSCEMLAPAFYEDLVVVRVKPLDFTGIRISLSYEITRKETGDLLAKGFTTNVFVDRKRRPVNLRKKYPEIYDKILEVFGGIEEDDLL